jgi:hypothetical protein
MNTIDKDNCNIWKTRTENEFGCNCSDTVKLDLQTIRIEQINYDVTEVDCNREGSMNVTGLLPLHTGMVKIVTEIL